MSAKPEVELFFLILKNGKRYDVGLKGGQKGFYRKPAIGF